MTSLPAFTLPEMGEDPFRVTVPVARTSPQIGELPSSTTLALSLTVATLAFCLMLVPPYLP